MTPSATQRGHLRAFRRRARWKRPLQREAIDGAGRDLCEPAVALAAVAAGIGEPVPRFLVRVQNPVGGDAAGCEETDDRQQT